MNLELFLTENNAARVDRSDERLLIGRLFPSMQGTIGLSGFNAPIDTCLYALLLGKATELIPPDGTSTLLDLGAGNSIPTLSALSRSREHSQLRVTAVDLNPGALGVGMENAKSLGFYDRYSFLQADMRDPVITADVRKDTLICSNPPYLPIPSWADKEKFFAVDGGEDGASFIEHILSSPQSPGTIFAIQWSSLSNPIKVLGLIEGNFRVVYAQYSMQGFGAYTRSPEILPYLRQQRERGLVAFNVDESGNHSYNVVGTILVRN